MPAVDLESHIRNIKAVIGEERFRDRCHELDKIISRSSRCLVLSPFPKIKVPCNPGGHRPIALSQCAHGQQGAPNVGVYEDGIGRLIRVFSARDRPSL